MAQQPRVQVRIRLASTPDLPVLLDLFHSVSDAMIGTPYDCFWRRDMHPTDEFIEHFVSTDSMLIAEDETGIVGAAGLDHDLGKDYGDLPWLVDAPADEVSVIHILAVLPERRGCGLSRILLKACLDESRRRGMRTARLDATVNNAPAIALYKSEGFATIGSDWQEFGPDDQPWIELLVMELPL